MLLELFFFLLHLVEQLDSLHPRLHVILLLQHALYQVFSENLHAADLTEDLQIVSSDLTVAAEVVLAFELRVEHRKNSEFELFQLSVQLLLCGCRLQRQFLRNEHRADALRHRPNFLVENGEQVVQLGYVVLHVQSVAVGALLVAVRQVHHLDQGAPVHALVAILENWNRHRGVRLLELSCHVLTLQHIFLGVSERQLRNLAVQLEGAAVGVETEADDVDVIFAAACDCARSGVNLILAQRCAHDLY